MLPIAVGLGLFGVILGSEHAEALLPMLGAAVLCGFVGGGLIFAGKLAENWKRE